MSDEHLRELERRWKESGIIEDEVAWLRERLRTGDIVEDKLQIAAILDYPAARLALNVPMQSYSTSLRTIKRELIRLGGFEGIIRMSHSLVRFYAVSNIRLEIEPLTQEALEELPPLVEVLNKGIDQVGKFLVADTKEERIKAKELLKALQEAQPDTIHHGNFYFLRDSFFNIRSLLQEVQFTGKTAVERANKGLSHHMKGMRGPNRERLVLIRFRDELVPWVLGYVSILRRIEVPEAHKTTPPSD